MRILADLPDETIAWLDERAAMLGVSRAQLLREAVANFRAQSRHDMIEHFFGVWADRALPPA